MKKRFIIWGLVALLVGSFFGFGEIGAENRQRVESAFRLTTTILNTAHTWVSSQTFTTVDINGGTIDGTTVGATTPATGTFTTLKATTGAATGLILKSDASGNLSYIDPSVAANLGLTNGLNPRGMAQGINMTAGTSGGGIAVADSVHLDQGTGPFTLSCKRNLASYVVAAILMEKHDDTTGYRLSTVVTTGYLKLEINDTTYTSNAAPVITAGTEHEFTVTASPGATNTTVTFYCDGIIVGTAQTATNETTTDNAVSFYAMGTDAIRTAGIDKGDIVYNRALTAAQVLSLYRNGVDFSDVGGSQTALIIGNNSNFNTVGNWAGTGATLTGGYDSGDVGYDKCLRIESSDGIQDRAVLGQASFVSRCIVGKLYRVTFDYKWINNDSISEPAATIAGSSSLPGFGLETSWTSLAAEVVALDTTGALIIYSSGITGSADNELLIDNVTLTPIGATLALEGEGMQPAPGQWLDSSSNRLHAMQPATGSSLVRLKKDFEFRWTNTWTASAAAQYIGGLNQSVLTAKHFIDSIVSRATVVTDVENIEIGDGAAAAYYVAAIAPTAIPIIHTLVKNLNDGTNFKLVVTPAASATMTVEFIVKGYLLE